MKQHIIEFTSNGDIPDSLVNYNFRRLGAFYYDVCYFDVRTIKLSFYCTESLKKQTKALSRKQFGGIDPCLVAVTPQDVPSIGRQITETDLHAEERIHSYFFNNKRQTDTGVSKVVDTDNETRSGKWDRRVTDEARLKPAVIFKPRDFFDVLVYGDVSTSESQRCLDKYVAGHNLRIVDKPFYDNPVQDVDSDYMELQKVLLLCVKKKCSLVIVSAGEMIKDIRFLNLLKNSQVLYRCIDYPWLCPQNLDIIRSVVLYQSLHKSVR